MQTIEIKNFGPVKNAKIDIKRLLVLIGEQASGKSTIAKLIYFFKSLSDDFFTEFYQSERENMNMTMDLIIPIREKFYDFFGSTFHLSDFEVTFYYSEDKWLKLSLNQYKKLYPEFSTKFFTPKKRTQLQSAKNMLIGIDKDIENSNNVRTKLALEQNKMTYIQSLSTTINHIFENKQNDSLFVIAGRNATVGYTDFFEKMLFSDIQKSIDVKGKQAFQKKEQTIDETLMLRFMERVSRVKSLLAKYGNLEGLINETDGDKRNHLLLANDLINKILRGKYENDSYGEKIKMNEEGVYVYLRNASSGQQECIRILQDIFVSIYEGNNVLRIIEEPEAHLFPVSQKYTLELLSLLLYSNCDNQLIITTHSPYVLTVLNNLLFASRVIDKNSSLKEEVSAIIPESFHLRPEDFSAYAIGDSFIKREGYFSNIYNDETGLINQNYLDIVSEILGAEFNRLYSTHAKTFTKK